MEFENKFLYNLDKRGYNEIDFANKYNTIKSLCSIVEIISNEYGKGKLIWFTKMLEENKNYDLIGCDLRLIDKVISSTYEYGYISKPTMEDKLNIMRNTLRKVYKNDIDHIVSSVMCYHMVSDKSVILKEISLGHFQILFKELRKEYGGFDVAYVPPKSEANGGKKIIVDPCSFMFNNEGMVLYLNWNGLLNK